MLYPNISKGTVSPNLLENVVEFSIPGIGFWSIILTLLSSSKIGSSLLRPPKEEFILLHISSRNL